MDFDIVLDKFCLISGLSSDNAELYSDIITICIGKIESKLKADVDAEDYENILTQLAATLSFYHYLLMSNVAKKHLIATDISMTTNQETQISCAKKLFDETFYLAKDLMTDSDFIFEVIQGESVETVEEAIKVLR